MFRAFLRPSSGGRNAFHCLWFSVLFIVVMLASLVARCTVHTSRHPTLQHHNNYTRTESHRQWNAVRPPDDGRKDARNMLRNNWLLINHYLMHLIGLTFIHFLFIFPNFIVYLYVTQYRIILLHFQLHTRTLRQQYRAREEQICENKRGSIKK
jgi:hypothetical protein